MAVCLRFLIHVIGISQERVVLMFVGLQADELKILEQGQNSCSLLRLINPNQLNTHTNPQLVAGKKLDSLFMLRKPNL